MAVIGVALAGCKSESCYPKTNQMCGDPQWGIGIRDAFDERSSDPTLKAAIHDLRSGDLTSTRINAAKTLGAMGNKADVNSAVEALEKGLHDDCTEVRRVSADALRCIGSPNALRHLCKAIEEGYVSGPATATPCTPCAAPMPNTCTPCAPAPAPCPAPKPCPAPCPKPCPSAAACPSGTCPTGSCPHNMSYSSCPSCRSK